MKSSSFSLRKPLHKKFNSRAQSRNKVALPKVNYFLNKRQISKTVFHSQQKSLPMQMSYLERISWVQKENDYSGVSTEQIAEQYNKLREQLLFLNEEVIKALTKIQNKPIRLKTIEKDNDKVLELLERQIQNNSIILQMHHKQFHLINKRAEQVSQNNSKYDIEEQIIKTKQKMQKTRLRIKELRKKNNHIGNSIVNTDDLFEQIKQLEVQKENLMRRKFKLEDKIKICQENHINTINKMSNISTNYDIAEQYFQKQNNKEHTQLEQKKQQQNFNHKKHSLEVNKKNMEATIHLKQQKYHQILKSYQQVIDKQQNISNKINQYEMETVNLKNIITQLQEKLRLLNLEKEQLDRQQRLRRVQQSEKASFFTEINQDTSAKTSHANAPFIRNRTDLKKKSNSIVSNDKLVLQSKKNSARIASSKQDQTQKWAKIANNQPNLKDKQNKKTQQEIYKQESNKLISQENLQVENIDQPQIIISEQKIKTDVKISEEQINSEEKINNQEDEQQDVEGEERYQIEKQSGAVHQQRISIPKKKTQQSADDDLYEFQQEVSSIHGKKSLRDNFSIDLGIVNKNIQSMQIKKNFEEEQQILDD